MTGITSLIMKLNEDFAKSWQTHSRGLSSLEQAHLLMGFTSILNVLTRAESEQPGAIVALGKMTAKDWFKMYLLHEPSTET